MGLIRIYQNDIVSQGMSKHLIWLGSILHQFLLKKRLLIVTTTFRRVSCRCTTEYPKKYSISGRDSKRAQSHWATQHHSLPFLFAFLFALLANGNTLCNCCTVFSVQLQGRQSQNLNQLAQLYPLGFIHVCPLNAWTFTSFSRWKSNSETHLTQCQIWHCRGVWNLVTVRKTQGGC